MAVGFALKPVLSETSDPASDLAIQSLFYMKMMREMEDRIERKLYRQGKILGGVYVGRGQEAIPVGIGLHARPGRRAVPFAPRYGPVPDSRRPSAQHLRAIHGPRRRTHPRPRRQHAHGRSAPEHHRDHQRHGRLRSRWPPEPRWPSNTKGEPNVAFCFFGDGATSRGDWHEGVNFAAVQRLPLVLICNNNQYAYSTPLSKQMAIANVADRAPAYGIPAEIVDGNDALAVHEAGRRAVEHARAGLGPYLIECKTFRMTGHSAHDGGDYVPKHLWEEWAAKDPIPRLERLMIEKRWVAPADLDRMNAGIAQQIDEAIDWAEKSPYPDPADLLDGVYAPER